MKSAFVFLVDGNLEKLRAFSSHQKSSEFFFCSRKLENSLPGEHWIVPTRSTHADRWILGASYELAQYFLRIDADFDRIVFVNHPELAFYPTRLFEQGFLSKIPVFYSYKDQSLETNQVPLIFNFEKLIVDDATTLTQNRLRVLEKLRDLPTSDSAIQLPSPRYAPSISVCIPTYNRPRELHECVVSLLEQSRAPQEILICDDGSTDPEVETVIAELKTRSPLIRSFKQENRYVGAARNALADRASSDYLVYLDDDNLAHSWMIETYRIALAVPNTAEGQNSIKDILVSPIDVFDGEKSDRPLVARGYFLGNSPIAGQLVNVLGDASICVRRTVAQELRYLEARDVGFEDWEFLLWAQARKIKIETLPVAVYRYRTMKQGSMRQSTSIVQNIQHAFSRVSQLESAKLRGLGPEAALMFQKIYSKLMQEQNNHAPTC